MANRAVNMPVAVRSRTGVDIPRGALVTFTGGPGTSSLAFGTRYAGARRRCQVPMLPARRGLCEGTRNLRPVERIDAV